MKMFLMVAGLMICCWIIQDALHPVSKKLDADTPLNNVLGYPLAFFMIICMTISIPIGLFMIWHDKRTNEVNKHIYLEDHDPYIEKLKSENDSLKIKCNCYMQENKALRKKLYK